jgi:hypothetical protein
VIDAAFALSAPSSAIHITPTTLSTRKTPLIPPPNAANGLAFPAFELTVNGPISIGRLLVGV